MLGRSIEAAARSKNHQGLAEVNARCLTDRRSAACAACNTTRNTSEAAILSRPESAERKHVRCNGLLCGVKLVRTAYDAEQPCSGPPGPGRETTHRRRPSWPRPGIVTLRNADAKQKL